MLQCFVRGCKQAQVAAGTKLQDHDLNLEPVHSSTFFSLFASPDPYHRRHFLEGETVQTVQKLGERSQWFPLNRFCIQKLARNPDDTKHRVVKKNSRCTIEPKQSFPQFLCEKSKQRRWNGHDCTSRVVAGWVDCQVLGHSMIRTVAQFGVQIMSTISTEKS